MIEINNSIDSFSFHSLLHKFFMEQLNKWNLAQNNYAKLNSTINKVYYYPSFRIKTQLNPERITSTSAKTDDNSVKSRECFLCTRNLPPEQEAILYNKKFQLLINPFPVVEKHFTISSVSHQPQRIENSFSDLLDLSRTFGKDYFILYNGPTCGASAPDHLHFQAILNRDVPLKDDLEGIKNEYGLSIIQNTLVNIDLVNDGLRRMMVIESVEKDKALEAFDGFIQIDRKLFNQHPEPMINILTSFDNEAGWQVVIFLREKHRPSLFFSEGNERLLISPASIDYAGLVIIPRVEDFEKADEIILRKIFDEVSISKINFELLIENYKR